MYQNVTEGKFMVFDKNFSNSSELYYLEPGLTLPLRILLKPWTLSFRKDTTTAKIVSQLKCHQNAKKNEIYLANEGSGVAFFSTDLGHFIGSNAGREFGTMLRGKGRHKPEFDLDLVRIHSLMIYTDLIEYNIVCDKKAPLLRCFLFISKLKAGDIITTGQNMNYQTFSKLQFWPLLKNPFHSNHIDLRDTNGEKIPFASVGITRRVLMLREASNISFWPNRRYKMVA